MPRLDMERAETLAARAFSRAGAGEAIAVQAARTLTLSEAMGISTHGLSRVGTNLKRIHAGGIDATAEPDIHAPAPALRHIDGRNGLGPAVAENARTTVEEAAAT